VRKLTYTSRLLFLRNVVMDSLFHHLGEFVRFLFEE